MAKILIVEDDGSLSEIYSIRLQADGHQVMTAADGEEGLAMAIREKPDLILSDVMMPRVSGFDMIDILKSTPNTQNIKIIVMTALSGDEQRDRGTSLGADGYLVKSQVGIEDVIALVNKVLAAPVASAPAAPSAEVAAPASAPEAAPAAASVAEAPSVPEAAAAAETAASEAVAPTVTPTPAPESVAPPEVTPNEPSAPAAPAVEYVLGTSSGVFAARSRRYDCGGAGHDRVRGDGAGGDSGGAIL
jgi:CheY-like chemotaxis protein